jgi:YhcH/YjgK/YiaL family protein
MILDSLASSPRWHGLHPGFAKAFDFLRAAWAQAPAPGKHVLEPDRLWIIVEKGQGRSHDEAPLEFHRRFIDIQLVLSGDEEMGWAPLTEERARGITFDQSRDIGFLPDPPLTWFPVPPGHLAVFYPDDAHAPLAGSGPVLKAIAKVAVEW